MECGIAKRIEIEQGNKQECHYGKLVFFYEFAVMVYGKVTVQLVGSLYVVLLYELVEAGKRKSGNLAGFFEIPFGNPKEIGEILPDCIIKGLPSKVQIGRVGIRGISRRIGIPWTFVAHHAPCYLCTKIRRKVP